MKHLQLSLEQTKEYFSLRKLAHCDVEKCENTFDEYHKKLSEFFKSLGIKENEEFTFDTAWYFI